MVGFALIMAGTVYIILEVELPRLGVIRIDAMARVLIKLRESMK